MAGESAGTLTEEGAKLLDPTGQLSAGIPLCPTRGRTPAPAWSPPTALQSAPETYPREPPCFAMIVLEKPLSKLYPEIDMVTNAKPANPLRWSTATTAPPISTRGWRCSRKFAQALGVETSESKLFEMLYTKGLAGDADCGGLLAYNYFSGEHLTHLPEGRPAIRSSTGKVVSTLANFMRTHLFLGTWRTEDRPRQSSTKRKVKIEQILGHGGFFRPRTWVRKIMAAPMNVPVSVMETAGEGGAWGMALLASYMLRKTQKEPSKRISPTRSSAGQKGNNDRARPQGRHGLCSLHGTLQEGMPSKRPP